MKIAGFLFLVLSAVAFTGLAANDSAPAMANMQHLAMTIGDLKWGDVPPVLPKGAQLSVLAGNPMAAGPYVIRLKLPAGYQVAPHWHPTDENITVIEGDFMVGMGDKFDASSMEALGAGGYASMPAQMHHFAMSKKGATIQIHGTGPFALTYVNPADDPSGMQGNAMAKSK